MHACGSCDLEADLHDDEELLGELCRECLQPGSVLEARLPVMDGRGADDDKKSIGLAVQQRGHLASSIEDLPG